MSGGGGSGQNNPMQAAQNATSSGSAGAVANMPTWQKGLLGAMSGNSAYGQNAPAIHQLLATGMQAMQPQQQGGPQMQRAMPRPMPQQMPASPGIAATGAPAVPSSGPMGQMSPQMLQQLMQQNPQLAQQLMSQMGQQGGGLMGH